MKEMIIVCCAPKQLENGKFVNLNYTDMQI